MSKFFKKTYQGIVFISVIGTIFTIFDTFFKKNDYNLTIFLNEQYQIIENNTGLSDLYFLYKDIKVTSLYGTKITLNNTGQKAITNDFIFDKLKVHINNNATIYYVNINQKTKNIKDNFFEIKFDLLNPKDKLTVWIITDKKPDLNFSYKIREIKDIEFINLIKNPPLENRILNISIWWYLIMMYAILITLDSLWLILGDDKLTPLLSRIKKIQYDKQFNREKTINDLTKLYQAYEDKLPYILIKKNEFIDNVSTKIDALDTKDSQDLFKLYKYVNSIAMHGNLYSMRGSLIIFGPILFFISLIGIIFSIVF